MEYFLTFVTVRQIVSILLLFLFSFSTMSFSVKLHYCKGNFKSIAFFGEAECGTCESHQSKHKHCTKHQSSAPCCETIIVSHNGATDFLNSDITKIDSLLDSYYIEPINYDVKLDLAFLNDAGFNYFIHPPPEYRFDFQVVFQTFLI